MKRTCLGALVVCACGRYSFDPVSTALDARDGATADVAGAVCLDLIGTRSNTVGANGQSIAAAMPLIYLGLTGPAQGMQVFDATDPSAPKPAGVFRTDSGPGMLHATDNDVLGITIVGSLGYLATYYGGLVIVDVSDPANPKFVGGVPIPNESWAVAIKANRAYVANHAGIVVVDVTTPTAPTIVMTLPLPGVTQDLAIDGSRLYVASKTLFHVIDITNPDAPVRTGGVTTGIFLYSVWSPGNGYAYVLDLSARELVTFAVSGATPSIADTRPPDSTRDLRCVDGLGSTVVVGTGVSATGALRTYSITTPSQPSLLSEQATTDEVFQVATSAGYVITTTADGNIQIWRPRSTCP